MPFVNRLNLPAEYKAAPETGSFSGYASVFGNVDLGGDVVERGAFKEFVTNREGKVVVLWRHDARIPIGTAKIHQDSHGLAFEGTLVMEDAKARTALAHMKAGSVEGMSIGFDILPGGQERRSDGVRLLTGVKLWEISVVTWGMNPLAGVEVAKAANIRELEGMLRDALCLSSRRSKAAANALWPILNERDAREGDREDREADVLGRLAAQLESLNHLLAKGI
jgi:HK97 family phage prohead protease